jgi:hypothetical protein
MTNLEIFLKNESREDVHGFANMFSKTDLCDVKYIGIPSKLTSIAP